MKILGYNYEIRQSETIRQGDAFGRNIIKDQVILVACDLPTEQEISTILHEVLEVLNFHLGLEIEHRAIMALDSALFQVLTEAGVDLLPLLCHIQRGKGRECTSYESGRADAEEFKERISIRRAL